MQIELQCEGEIVERSELLNGTESVTIDGAGDGAGSAWTIVSMLAWNLGLIDFAGEGDLTLARDDGAELYATATSVRVEESAAGELAFRATYEIDGGAGAFEGATGSVRASGVLSESGFSGTWQVVLGA